MDLSKEQIERYSRQILVSQFGGIGQQRLLKSSLVIAGEIDDLALVLPYLVGAGVGTIRLLAASNGPGDDVRCGDLINRMKLLNREVSIEIIHEVPADSSVLFLMGSQAALEQARALWHVCSRPLVAARMAEPAQIAVIGSHGSINADSPLMAPLRRRANSSNLAAMIAAVEILKCLASANPPDDTLIEFDGYSSHVSPLPVVAGGHTNECAQAAQPAACRIKPKNPRDA